MIKSRIGGGWGELAETGVLLPLCESLFFRPSHFCPFLVEEDASFVRSKAPFIPLYGCCKKLVIWLVMCCTCSTFLATTYFSPRYAEDDSLAL